LASAPAIIHAKALLLRSGACPVWIKIAAMCRGYVKVGQFNIQHSRPSRGADAEPHLHAPQLNFYVYSVPEGNRCEPAQFPVDELTYDRKQTMQPYISDYT
jgi:hypothetical protein